MPDDFTYDVFLSHSANGTTVVRTVAERLRKDGVMVWFDSARIGRTFRFPDPLNKERRFLPLRLDDAPIKGGEGYA